MRYKVSVKLHRDFVGVEGDEIVVGVTAKPQKGEANRELLRKIAKHFGVPSSSVRLVSGAGSRKKIIDVQKKE